MEFLSLEELRCRGTRKWTVFADDVIPLWIAESDFPTAPVVREAIQKAVDNECFGYTPATSTLSPALADFYERRFGWKPAPSHIVWIGDVVRGMLLGVQHFTRPGSAVAVPVPSYPPLLEIPHAAGREIIKTGLDLASIEEAFKGGAGSILLANPFNPLGKVFDEQFLSALVELAERYDARILSDEIHGPLVFEGRHIPVASLSDAAARRTITVTATSKAFNVAGLKCAQIIFSNDHDLEIWQKLNGVEKDGTGTLGVIAAATAYEQGNEFLDEEIEVLRENRDFICSLLKEKIPGIKFEVPQATYLLWLDFRETSIPDKHTPAAWLAENARVGLNEGITFDCPGHARLNFATSKEILAEAVERMAEALK